MKFVKNEKGLTLVEVVAGIVLISIVLLGFFVFFTNAANFNATNNSNITASNIVREEITLFNETYNGIKWEKIKIQPQFNNDPMNPKIYKQVKTRDEYIIEISINSEAEVGVQSTKEHRAVKIAVWKGKIEGNPLSESYTYHEVEGS